MNGHVPTAYEIETASGRYVDVFYAKPATITLEDIAHGLAFTCRFGGQSSRFYSVAEHAVLVADKLVEVGHPLLALTGLHHDDHEAYLGDIPRPVKLLLDRLTAEGGDSQWRDVQADLDHAIWLALSWDPVLWLSADFACDVVKAVDDWALATEAHYLLPSKGATWGVPCQWPVGREPACMGPGAAREAYLRAHADYLLAAIA